VAGLAVFAVAGAGEGEEDPGAAVAVKQIPVGLGSGQLRFVSGPVVVASAVQAVLVGVHAGGYAGRLGVSSGALKLTTAVAVPVWVSYFGPTVAGMSATLLVGRASDATGADVAAGLLGAATQVGTLVWLGVVIVRMLPSLVSVEVDARGKPRYRDVTAGRPSGAPSFVHCFGPVFDAAKDARVLEQRVYYLVDVGVTVVSAVVVGLSPSPGAGCVAAGVVLVLVALVGLAYVTVIRPYRTRLDQLFAVGIAVGQVCLVLALLGSQRWSSMMAAAGWITIGLSVAFFAQAIVIAIWAVIKYNMRNREASANAATDPVNVQLLEIPSLAPTKSNPLVSTCAV